jgi:hypothetical protein
MNKQFAVAISMRGERDVGLNKEDQLIIRHGLNRINMGVMSDIDIDNMCEYLQRLKIHLPKKEVPKPKPGEPGFEWEPCGDCGSTSLRCGCY